MLLTGAGGMFEAWGDPHCLTAEPNHDEGGMVKVWKETEAHE